MDEDYHIAYRSFKRSIFHEYKEGKKKRPKCKCDLSTLGNKIICEKKQPTHKGWIGWVILGGRSFIFEIIGQHITPGWSSEETQCLSYDNLLAGKVKVSGLHTLTQLWVCIGETNISLGSRRIDRCLSGVFLYGMYMFENPSGSNNYAIVEVRNCCEQSICNTYSFKQKE